MIHWSWLIISSLVLIVSAYIWMEIRYVNIIGSILETLGRHEKMINSIRNSRLDRIVSPQKELR